MNEHQIRLTTDVLRHVEKAQQGAHDPSRWKAVVAHLAAARGTLARLREEMGAEPVGRVASAADLTPPLFTGLGEEVQP